MDIASLATERQNQNSEHIDEVDTFEMLRIINGEDKTVPLAVEKELLNITKAVDLIYDRFLNGGRLFYIGAGTSGRLGVLDASECPPTYGVGENLVIGLIAGGDTALRHAVEGAEDSFDLCKKQLEEHSFSEKDVVCGIAASGRTPFVLGGMKYAKNIGAAVISVTCSPDSQMAEIADVSIAPIVGPEVITGSTRMKAGTAQKLVLNMLTTATMIKLGKVYGNLMVDVQPTNKKLIDRAKRMVMLVTDCDENTAIKALKSCENHPKTAIIMIKKGIDAFTAKQLLEKSKGKIKAALSDE